MARLIEVDAAAARAALALAVLGEAAGADARLGAVVLRAHQVDAVRRVRASLAEFGGALLADEVGLGKTYVALALAREATRPLVVAPAALRAMWERASGEAGERVELTTFETLSRGRIPAGDFDLVIVDEAHHARNPDTRRYRALSVLTANARVLLLSATPIHNRRADLTALLALFLGSDAEALHERAIARCLIRRERRDVQSNVAIPAADPPTWLPVSADDDTLAAIVALPPPVPPAGGGDGGALVAHALVRQWASSDGALREALRRRLARAAALAAALESGRHPTAGELRSWAFADGAVQLAFPQLLAATPVEGEELLQAVRAHGAAAEALLQDLAAGDDRDGERAQHLRRLRARHEGQKIVAFSQYAETVRALYRRLVADAGVAALTASGAVVAGGSLSRQEALARFAPRAAGAGAPRRGEEIHLLLTTDLLSEGVNLQDASVVVHLDLPWTPARLEQRVGRVRRAGSSHERVWVYALSPPATAEALLRVEQRVREKMRIAERAIGVVGTILPPLAGEGPPPSGGVGRDAERIRAALGAWVDGAEPAHVRPGASGLVSAVRAECAGYLAACVVGHRVILVASLGGAPSDRPALVARAAELAAGESEGVDINLADRAIAELGAWVVRREAADCAEVRLHPLRGARRKVVERIANIARRTAAHRRPLIAALAAAAWRAAAASSGAGSERVLLELAAADMPDEAWLRAITTFGALHSRSALPTRETEKACGESGEPVALILLTRPA